MTDQWYSVHSFMSSPDGTDLSALFNNPGVADTSRNNNSTGWRLVSLRPDTITPQTNWNGPVNADGSLTPGALQPGTTFFDTLGYSAPMQVQVAFTAYPTAQCGPCNGSNTGSLSCPVSPKSSGGQSKQLPHARSGSQLPAAGIHPNAAAAGVGGGSSFNPGMWMGGGAYPGGKAMSVELATGRFVLTLPLLSIGALGAGQWSFDLSYYANFGIDGIVGKNWNYPQFDYLNELASVVDIPGNAELVSSNNTREIFTWNTVSYDPSDNNTGCTLVRSGTGPTDQFTLTAPDGTVSIFFGFDASIATPGQLQTTTDRFGNTLSLTWASVANVPQLQSVTDGYGRVINYSYTGPEFGYRLAQIEDFLGRQLNFQYDSLGHLVAVVTPSVMKAAEGNTFPGGTAWAFEYDVNNPRTLRRDDVLRIWSPNQTQPFLDTATRTLDVASVYAQATPRYTVVYGQDPTDADTWGKVLSETIGDPVNSVGGTFTYAYTTTGLPTNIIDTSTDAAIVSQTTMTDRNGNISLFGFDVNWRLARSEVQANRGKLTSAALSLPTSYVTWTKFNGQGQPLVIVNPAGDSVEFIYETGVISGLPNPYVPRRGLLLALSRLPGNSISIPSQLGSNGQTVLSTRMFYEPIYNQLAATIEERGNPIDDPVSGTYFAPQNLGTTPTDADRSRYASITYFDYQKDVATAVTGDTTLQSLLGLSSTQIGDLISYVNGQLTATDGTGGIPAGFALGLGDINGDGTGNATGGLPAATHLGNAVKTQSPSARLLLPTTTTAYSEAVLADAPFAYWRLGDSSGTTAVDASGNGNAGTYAGGFTLGQTGAVLSDSANTAVALNGTTGYVDTGDGARAIGSYFGSGCSFECWYKTSSTAQQTMGTSDSSASVLIFLDLNNAVVNTISVTVEDSAGNTIVASATAPTPLSDGAYHHYVTTVNGAAKTITIYFDGQPLAVTYGARSILAAPAPLLHSPYLGALHFSGGAVQLCAGTLDEVAFYPSILSAGRVLTHYNAALATDPWFWAEQSRVSIRTVNLRGQTTTATDAEGNSAVFLRYPENDPDGDGQIVSAALSAKQYGMLKETHVDADPNMIMSLVGSDGDLVDFVPGIIARANTPGSYLDLVTRNGGGSRGCSVCSYDALGNVLSTTDARGFTTVFDRNELGDVYRVTSPAPYNYKVERYFDANGNVVRVDTEDQQVAYESGDPTDPLYAQFMPSGNGMSGLGVAQVPTMPGPGGTLRPGWFSNLFTFDLLDNKISQDIDATGSDPASLVTTFQFDANQNLVLVTKPAGNIVEIDYDERDLRVAQRVGYVSPTQVGAVTIWVYDANGNLIDVIGPTDRTGNAGTVLSATIADAFRSEIPLVHTGDWALQNTYDGFDRVTQSTDAVGNFTLNLFDPGSRVIQGTRTGLIGGTSPTNNLGTGNVTLALSFIRFDEAGRQYEAQQQLFLPVGTTLPSGRTVTHIGGGLATNSTANSNVSDYVLTRNVYDRADRLAQQSADNTAATVFTLDGAGRVIASQDALGNQMANTFDGNGNVIAVTRTEIGTMETALGSEIFQSAMRYDSLNRMVLAAQQGADGQITNDLAICCSDPTPPSTLVSVMGFDSRGNRTLTVDAKGNTTVSTFDGASRQTQTLVHMRLDGTGPNPPAGNTTFLESGRGVIRTDVVLDGNGRVIQLIDDRGGNTWFGYDSLDRQITLTFHDGSVRTNTYNFSGDVIGYVDENGSAFTFAYDAAGRRVTVGITPATGVGGTTSQIFQYDGLSRMTVSKDVVGLISPVTTEADFYYDSLSRVVEEAQAGYYMTHQNWLSYPATRFTFENGRQITFNHDALYRKSAVGEYTGSTNIASWQFFGGRIATVTLGNGVVCSFMNNAQSRSAIQAGLPTPPWGSGGSDQLGFDGAGRVIAKRYLIPGSGSSPTPPTLLVGFTTAYDRSSNKLFERHLHAESRSHLYPAYDSPDRLLEYQRGVLNTGGASISTAIALPGTDTQRSYTLDGLGNWNNTIYTQVGESQTTEYRRHNYLNQITSFAGTSVLYDHGNNAASTDPNVKPRGNGNIADDGIRLYQYDALNRLIQVNRKSDSALIATYAYDALGRRRSKTVSAAVTGTVPTGTSVYLYVGARVVEEFLDDGPIAQYVWGQYIDELIQLKALTTIGPQMLAAGNYYLLSDLLYRSVALTDSTGAIVETYDTDAYGNPLLFQSAGMGYPWFTDNDVQADYSACRYVFTGREYDAETEIHFYRSRHYSPVVGRWIQRDPAGMLDNANLYAYTGGNPANTLDPSGLASVNCEQLETDARDDLSQWKQNATASILALSINVTQAVTDMAAWESQTVAGQGNVAGALSGYFGKIVPGLGAAESLIFKRLSGATDQDAKQRLKDLLRALDDERDQAIQALQPIYDREKAKIDAAVQEYEKSGKKCCPALQSVYNEISRMQRNYVPPPSASSIEEGLLIQFGHNIGAHVKDRWYPGMGRGKRWIQDPGDGPNWAPWNIHGIDIAKKLNLLEM